MDEVIVKMEGKGIKLERSITFMQAGQVMAFLGSEDLKENPKPQNNE